MSLELNRDEALVLFEWLHRCEDEGGVSQPEHPAERVALWNLSAILERKLTEPFKQNYHQLIDEARERLVGSNGQA